MNMHTSFAAVMAILFLFCSTQTLLAQGNDGNNSGNKYGIGKPVKAKDLPPGQLRNSLESLPPGLQKRAIEWLQALDFPKADVDTLRISADGDVYYADFGLIAEANLLEVAPGAVIEAALPDPDLFTLHSKPGSSNVVYLDFDGHTITGTAWNNGLADPLIALPFDPTGDDVPATVANFSDEERKRIQEIWHRMSEDFAPFDIDVTTEEPAVFTPTTGRVLFTHDTDANGNPMPEQGAGGVAFSPVFGWSNYATYYSPALVYYTNLYTNAFGDATLNSEAGSHEFGHNLSLSHDGTSTTSYYAGHGSGRVRWGTIMGSSYQDSVTQWSKGEYPDANNSQDDLAVLDSKLGYNGDVVGDTSGSANPLTVEANGDILVSDPEIDPDNLLPANKGVIEDRNDVDWWYLDVGAGALSITVTPSWHAFNSTAFASNTYRGSNLDVDLALYDASLTLVASDEPTDETDATIAIVATTGRYFLRIDGTGNSVGDGYSDYASIGMYFIEGTSTPAVADTTPPTPDPMTWATAPNTTGANSMNMVANTATDPSGVEYEFVCVAGGAGCASSGWQASPTYNASGLTASTFYSWKVRAQDRSALTNTTGDSPTLGDTTDPEPPATPIGFGATAVSSSQIDLTWTDNTDETGYLLERSPDGSTGWSAIASLAADTVAYSDSGLNTGTTYYYRLSASNTQGNSGYATSNATTFQLPPDFAPTGLTATAVSTSQIDLAWTDNSSNEDSFQIERSADGAAWSILNSVGANVQSYQDTGLNTNETWYYRVFARNSAADSSPTNVSSATTDAQCTQTTQLFAGIWKLMALPCNPGSQNSVAEIFSNLTAGDLGTTWYVYTVNNATKEVLPLGIGDAMTPGAAYVVYSASDANVTVRGTNNTIMDAPLSYNATFNLNYVGYTGSASRTWSTIIPMNGAQQRQWSWADRYSNSQNTFHCDMDPVGDRCRISRIYHVWNGSSYDPHELNSPSEGTLDPFDVMVVFSYRSNVGLRIPQTSASPPAASGVSADSNKANKPNRGKKNKGSEWNIRLTAQSGRYMDKGNFLGRLSSSTNGQDSHDLEELTPLASPYLSLTFDNPAFDAVDWGYATDFRELSKAPQGEWAFTVRATPNISEVTLRWQGESIPKANTWLIDEQTLEAIAVNPGGSYTFTMDASGESRFRFLVE